MSYTIRLSGRACQYCGCVAPNPELPNPTYNLLPIFHLALTFDRQTPEELMGLHTLTGKAARDTVEKLRIALDRIRDPNLEAEFKELEPSFERGVNGWGDKAGAEWVLGELLAAAIEYPNHVWEVQ